MEDPTSNGGVFTAGFKTNNPTAYPDDYFFSDDTAYDVWWDSTNTQAALITAHVHDANGSKPGAAGFDQTTCVSFKPTAVLPNAALEGKNAAGYARGWHLTGNSTSHWTLDDGFTAPCNFCLDGHNIDVSSNPSGSVITVNSGKTLNLYDCKTTGKITGGKAASGGGVYVSGTFNMFGGIISGNEANGTDSNAITGNGGGGIFIGGTVLIDGADAKITTNKTTNNSARGGGIAVSNGGSLTLVKGEISSNSTQLYGGGGIWCSNNAANSFTMSGGVIKENYCGNSGSGGGICASGGTITLTGGTITGNRGGDAGGGVLFDATATLIISGNPIISGNTLKGAANNIYLKKDENIIIAGALTNATGTPKIGVTVQTLPTGTAERVFTQGDADGKSYSTYNTISPEKIFFYDGGTAPTGCDVYWSTSGKEAALIEQLPAHEHNHFGESGTDMENTTHGDAEKTAVVYKPWYPDHCLPDTAGKYYLTKNVTLTKDSWTVPAGVNDLCLNGYSIARSSAAGTPEFSVVTVVSGRTLKLADCYKNQTTHGWGEHTGISNYFKNQAGTVTETVYGGVITGGKTKGYGAGVYNKGGTFELYGGWIAGNTGDTMQSACGGVWASERGEFRMYGGKIAYNMSFDDCAAGGVGIKDSGKMWLYGGDIFENWAGSKGGGLFVADSSEFHMQGGTIRGNTAACTRGAANGGGGGIFIRNSNVEITGGTITGNQALKHYGGGIYTTADASTTLTISDCEITGNTSGLPGGGIYVNSNTALKVSGRVTVSGNTENGTVSYNSETGKYTATGTTGNIYLLGSKNLTVTGPLTGAKIGVTCADTAAKLAATPAERVFTTGYNTHHTFGPGSASDPDLYFFSDNPAYDVWWDSTEQNAALIAAHVHDKNGRKPGDAAADPETMVRFKPTATLPTAALGGTDAHGYARGWYLTGNDSDRTTTWNVPGDSTHACALCLNGHEVSRRSSASEFSVVTMDGTGGTLNLYDCGTTGTITGGKAAKGGGVYITGGVFNMYNGKITGNQTSSNAGGGVFLSGTFRLYGGEISNNTSVHGAGGVMISEQTSRFEMSGGSISSNRAAIDGGGVYAYGTFVMSGGTINGNTANNGGGVCMGWMGGHLFMSGSAVIENNSAISNGGGVNLYNYSDQPDIGHLSISGNAVIRKNSTNGNGGGVYVDGSIDSLSGSVHIYDNKKGTAQNNVYLPAGKKITVTGSLAGASVGVTMANPADGADFTLHYKNDGAATPTVHNGEINPNTYFFSDNGVYDVNWNVGNTEGRLVRAHIHKLDGTHFTGNTLPANSEYIRFEEWTNPGMPLSAPDEGYGGWYMAEDVGNAGSGYSWDFSSYNGTACTLCLNGHELHGTGNGSVITVTDGKTLNLTDCTLTTPVPSRSAAHPSGWVRASTDNGSETSFSFSGGWITGGGGAEGGGVKNKGTFNLYGGTIAGNSVTSSGGGVSNEGTFHMYGGNIACNSAGSDGGGVYVKGGTTEIEGGRIAYNAVNNGAGGGIRGIGGSLTLNTGAKIDRNSAPWGGGVGTTQICAFSMTGGNISYNYAKSNKYGGGGIMLGSQGQKAATITGGTISYNVSHFSGGGISAQTVNKDATVTITGVEISHNVAETYGGGIAAEDAAGGGETTQVQLSIGEGTTISENAAVNGGGIYFAPEGADAKLTVSGGTISGNTATGDGGGVYSKGTFTMSGGTISGNKGTSASSRGGGVYSEGPFTMTGGTIGGSGSGAGNEAYDGGGIFAMKPGPVRLEGGTISYNTALKAAGVRLAGTDETSSGAAEMTATVTGSVLIDHNTAHDFGAGMTCTGRIEVTMSGGTISNNRVDGTSGSFRAGGGIDFASKFCGTATLSGGKITGNSAPEGAGIVTDSGSGTIIFAGTEISGNTASISGGGFTTKNTHTATLQMYGAPVIKDNTAAGKTSNFCLDTGKTVEITGTLTGSAPAQIGITVAEPSKENRVFTQNYNQGDVTNSADPATYFFSDDAEYQVVWYIVGENKVEAMLGAGHKHNHYGEHSTLTHTDDAEFGFQPWTSGTSLPTEPGAWYLTQNVTLSDGSAWTVPSGKFELCLNGHSITQTKEISVVQVEGGTLNIIDCFPHNSSPDDTMKNHPYTKYSLDSAGSGITASAETVDGGLITGGKGTYVTTNIYYGGGLNITGGTVTMYGGHISGNGDRRISDGGGVNVSGGSSFTAAGGTVSHNYAKMGGGVRGIGGGNITITDKAEITENASIHGGAGAAFSGSGLFKMNGGSIFKNKDGKEGGDPLGGGGVNFGSGFVGRATFSGGEIHSNSSLYNGGGISLRTTEAAGGTVVLTGTVKIYNNTTAENGGGVYVYGNSAKTNRLELSQGPAITGNLRVTASGESANNVYLPSENTVLITAALTNTDKIGVTLADNTGVFTSQFSEKQTNGKTPADIFTSDNPVYMVVWYVDGGVNTEGQIVIAKHTVIFYMANQTDIQYKAEDVDHGAPVDYIAGNDTAAGVFNGWYTDAGLTDEYDFYAPVLENLKLYPRYITASGMRYAGGLIGSANGTVKIENSFAASVVRVLGVHVNAYTGGLIGSAGGTLTVSGSYADCYLRGTTVGGLAGMAGSSSAVTDSYAAGYVLDAEPRTVAGQMIGSLGTFTAGGASYTLFCFNDDGAAETFGNSVRGWNRGAQGILGSANGTTDKSTFPYWKPAGPYPYPNLGLNHYGDWTVPKHTVTFVYPESAHKPDVQQPVGDGGTASAADAQLSGYDWYTDLSSAAEQFTFSTKIYRPLTLYGRK